MVLYNMHLTVINQHGLEFINSVHQLNCTKHVSKIRNFPISEGAYSLSSTNNNRNTSMHLGTKKLHHSTLKILLQGLIQYYDGMMGCK